MRTLLQFGLLTLVLAVTGCAKRGTITGGLKDTIPPTLQSAIPENYSVDFKGNVIKLNFSEYIKLKNLNKQLIISPPMKTAPDVQPTLASKTLTIRLRDTLKPNTTYSLNFGQAIEDNNEANPLRQFKYVFSTGPYIDSLTLGGRIKDALEKKADNFVTVMLYEANEKFNDSIIYKEQPRYVTNTLDSATTFKLENLKAGKYLLVALKDANNNYQYDPKSDKIAFQKQFITVPNDTIFELELFKELQQTKFLKPGQASGNRLVIGYEGDPREATFTAKRHGQDLPVIATQMPKKDSLQLWVPTLKLDANAKIDSLELAVSKGSFNERFLVKIKNQKVDTLSVSPSVTGTLPLRDKFVLTASVPLAKFDESKISVQKDSAAIPFKTAYDAMRQEFSIDFTREPVSKYKIQLLPGALTDYLERANDTLKYNLETRNSSEYGNLVLTLEQAKRFPVIIQLTNEKGEVQYESYSEGETRVAFDNLKPAVFTLRFIYDDNKNRRWDAGNYLAKRQSEEVIYFPKEVDVRANWDVEQPVNLSP